MPQCARHRQLALSPRLRGPGARTGVAFIAVLAPGSVARAFGDLVGRLPGGSAG